MSLKWVPQGSGNVRKLHVIENKDFTLAQTVIDIYTGPVVTIGSLLIATGSVVAMLVCLKKISRFKNSFNITHNRVGVVSIPNEDEDDDIDNGEDNHDDGVVGAVRFQQAGTSNVDGEESDSVSRPISIVSGSVSSSPPMDPASHRDRQHQHPDLQEHLPAGWETCRSVTASKKEAKVAQQMMVVLVIFIFCKLPMVAAIMKRFFTDDHVLEDDYVTPAEFIVSSLRSICEALSASINIFVYYRYNTRYRTVYRNIMCHLQ